MKKEVYGLIREAWNSGLPNDKFFGRLDDSSTRLAGGCIRCGVMVARESTVVDVARWI
jgi:hypothetical protein